MEDIETDKDKTSSKVYECWICEDNHCLMKCDEFRKMNINDDMRHYGNALLQVVAVNISNKNHTVTVNALLDSGADSIIIDKEIATRLELQGINCQLNLSSAISATKTLPSKLVSFQLSPSLHPKYHSI